MTKEQIREAANEYARNNCDGAGNVESSKFAMSQHGFIAGANWAGQPENITDDQIMAVLNAIGYEERSWIEIVRKDIARRYGAK